MDAPAAAPPEIDIDTFSAIPVEVRDNTVYIGGRALCLDGAALKTVRVANGEAH
jgi:hypothetical protein